MNIFCIEQNYLTNKRERENHIFGEPIIFVKPETALLAPRKPFQFKKFDDYKLYVQVEIVLRISKGGKNIAEQDASSHYDAITSGVNFTAIDIHDELNGIQVPWQEAKAWENSSIIGTWIPASGFKNKNDINFCMYKNREIVQLGNSELMIYDFDKLITSISKIYEIQSGDVIFTGTPAGIGEAFKRDKIEAFVEDDPVLEFRILF